MVHDIKLNILFSSQKANSITCNLKYCVSCIAQIVFYNDTVLPFAEEYHVIHVQVMFM